MMFHWSQLSFLSALLRDDICFSLIKILQRIYNRAGKAMGEHQGQEGEEEQVRMWVLRMLILILIQQSSLVQKKSTIITHPTHTIHQS